MAFFVLFGCADISTDAYYFDSTSAIVSGAMKNYRLAVSANRTLLSTNASSAAKTLVPAAYNANDLNFYLGGLLVTTKNQKSNVVVQKVPFTADENSNSTGIVTATLGVYCYELVLIAIPASKDTTTLTETTYISDLLSKAVLYGSATADLRYNDGNSVSFNLSSDALNGTGAYNLDLYLNNWSVASRSAIDSETRASVISSATIGLYNLSGGSALTDTEATQQDFTAALSAASAYSYKNSEVASGTYDLIVSFKYNGKYFIYSDKIIILPYQTTAATIAIPDVLQTVPAAPTGFNQGYLEPVNDETDYYRVAFEWSDNSNTETGFEIQLLNISDNENATASASNDESFWNTNATDSTIISYTTKNFSSGSGTWYALSLERNSTGAVFLLPLGKRYYARIRAVNNDVGGSAWCYANSSDVSLTVAAGDSTAESASLSYAKTFNSTAFRTPIINLFRITYNLIGGSLSPVVPTKYYFDQVVGGNPVLSPNTSSFTLTKITSDGTLNWLNWACNSIDGAAYQNSFTRCSSVSDFDSDKTYYVPWTQEADVNGSTTIYKPSSPQPTEFTEDNYSSYYMNDGTPTNYVGYKNLSLYAVYENDNGTQTVTDYSIKTNLNFSVSVDGNAVSLNDKSFTVSANATTLSIVYNYNTANSFTYDSVTLTLTEDGGSEIGTYSQDGQFFTIPVSMLSAGTDYIITIKATKNGASYATTLLMSAE